MAKINLDLFDTDSIDNAIKQIEEFQKEIDTKASETVKDVAEQSCLNYKAKISGLSGIVTDNNANGTHVNCTKVDDKTYSVNATGQALFVEFGTGITKADSQLARADISINGALVAHGEYGKKKASNPDGWYDPYHKRWTKGFGAKTPLYTTKKEAKALIQEKLKEKFR